MSIQVLLFAILNFELGTVKHRFPTFWVRFENIGFTQTESIYLGVQHVTKNIDDQPLENY